ncbi:MAG: FAD-binding oxidoreductase [Acidobacteria bacterium]|nr:FAD-binding oxidoreductase [Acidobacteriota bacterium]MCW5970207.1 FAD-binding oxidoreductase [Blastocatellales bacterium]
MVETAEVVIIGGGIVGSSVAYHLADAGCTDVLVIEREEKQGMGSTGKSMGGVRAQFATPVNIEMSIYAIDFFNRFEEATGHTPDYRPHGYLFAATTEAHLDYLKSNLERQIDAGLKNAAMVAADDIRRIVPQLRSDDILGGSFCATDGFVDPYSVMRGFASRAKDRGVRFLMETEVTGIEVDGGEVRAVKTSRGKVSTRIVVNAGGPWAGLVAGLAGVDLPVRPLRRQLVNTQRCDFLPTPLPMIIDMSSGFHFRREGEGILMAWPDPEETYGFKTAFDPEFIEKILIRAVDRVPAFADLPVNPHRCWAGMYEVTPDHHAVLGEAPGVKGFYLANGFSGHGVMHSPATGRILSDLILAGKTDVVSDVRALGVERFAEGRLLEETAVL